MAMDKISQGLEYIFKGISLLHESFPDRKFTIDGRLVGDIGEVIASHDFEINLDNIQKPTRDGVTFDGREVQIKATFKDSLTFRTVPELYLGIKVTPDGSYKVIYNGPSDRIEVWTSKRVWKGFAIFSDKRSFEIVRFNT